MNLLFFQSPHYSLGVSEMQGMLIQYSQFPFKTRVSLLLSQSGVSRHYSHHFLHATIDLPDPSRSNLTPGPIPRVTPIHRSHVLIDWSFPQGMRCCTVSQTAVAKKMVYICTCFLHPAYTPWKMCMQNISMFFSPTRLPTVARSAYGCVCF